MNKRRLCAICDEFYNPDSDRAKVHEHPEPQSGDYRTSLIAYTWLTGFSYMSWVVKTQAGADWARYQRGEITRDELPVLSPSN